MTQHLWADLGDAEARAERYRLAWLSARRRAENERGSHAMTMSSFQIFVESMREDAQRWAGQVERLAEVALDAAERHNKVRDALLRQVAELTDERDEARAEVV